jgi:hypothetical protein
VDANGFEYVAGGQAGAAIAVEPPDANRVPADLYYIPPVRTVTLNDSLIPWPSILAVNRHNEVVAAVTSAQGNAIKTFAGGAGGWARAVRCVRT